MAPLTSLPPDQLCLVLTPGLYSADMTVSDPSDHWPSPLFRLGSDLSHSHWVVTISSIQFSSVAQSCLTFCDPMNRSMPGLPVYHHLLELTQTHVHRVSDAIQPSHPGSSPSPPAPNPSQHQSLFQWVNSLHEVAKVLELRDRQINQQRELGNMREG